MTDRVGVVAASFISSEHATRRVLLASTSCTEVIDPTTADDAWQDRRVPCVPLPYPDAPLSDGSIAIRPWLETDLDCIEQASLDPVIPRGTTVPARYTREEGLAFIRRQWSRAVDGVGVSQAIVDARSDVALGLVVVSFRPQRRVAGLGYWVVPQRRGRGTATAAVNLITPWAFEALQVWRLEALVEPDNTASQHVLRNAGFVEEGRLRNFFSTDNGPADALVFSAIPAPT